jgi:deoxyribodipyrimidine photolyase-related protein
VDNWIEKRLAKIENLKIVYYPTPMFINSDQEIRNYFREKKRLYQTDFYIAQRKTRNILLDPSGNPIGGKWTFDTENRKKYPKDKVPPKIKLLKLNKFDIESHQYIEKNFSNNYGNLTSKYASTFDEAKTMLNDFFENRFNEFGEYEDAIVEKEGILHHSILTPMLNCGLLTPQFVIDETLKYGLKNEIPINSLEGFIRQILGWREFIRAVYILKGTEERTKNYWSFKRKIPKSFYNASTKIIPIDDAINKVLKTGYNHHIERLMLLGNIMLLLEIRPNDVYKWFMEMYIDAYDWVMVPNVYGMSQFADGGLMATKPYISGSNYVMKMSDYKKGDWQEIWDALFWCFMDKQRAFFLKNPRLGMLIKTYDKMSDEKKKNYYDVIEEYLKNE